MDLGHEETGFDAVHANYWLSGIAGHRIKHELDLPLVSTFHTLARVKAEASPEEVERRAPPAGRGRGRRHALLGGRAGLVLGRGRAARRALRQPTRPASASWPPASTTPSSVPATGPRPAGPSACRPRPAAAVRGADPAAQGCRRGRAGPGRAGRPTTPTPTWSSWGARAVPAARSELALLREARRRAGPGRPGALRGAPAPRAALHLLPGRRCLCRAQPVGVLRPGGPRGGGVRDAGGGRRGRRAHHPRRPRPHRLPGRRPSTPEAFAAWVRRSWPTRCWPSAWPPPRSSGPAATPGPRPPRCCVPPTRSSPPSASSSAR